MYCESCGKKRHNNEKFCTNCGKSYPQEGSNYYSEEKKINNINNQSQSTSDATIILGVISLVFFFIPILSIPLAIASLIIGIKNKQRLSNLLPAVISLIIMALAIIFIVVATKFFYNEIKANINDSIFEKKYYEDYYEDTPSSDSYDISGQQWVGNDNSLLNLNKNNNYIWYQSSTNQDDNFYQGTYEFYTGSEAIKYIANNLQGYGLTEYIQQQNIIASKHSINEYYLIILTCDKVVINGNEQTPDKSMAYYYGYYEKKEEYLDLTDISTEIKAGFTKKDTINTIGIHKKFRF